VLLDQALNLIEFSLSAAQKRMERYIIRSKLLKIDGHGN